MAGGRRYSSRRVRDLMLYIASKDTTADMRKIFAVMFVADMEAYRMLGRSITGATYVKTPLGLLPMTAKQAKEYARGYEH